MILGKSIRMVRVAALAVLAVTAAGVVPALPTDFDFDVTITNSGASSYSVTSAPVHVVPSIPALNNPTITLLTNKRYKFTTPSGHPFGMVQKGSAAYAGIDPVTALVPGGIVGSFESQVGTGVDWLDAGGGVVYFTVTTALRDSLTTGSFGGGYQCLVPHASMRGDIVIQNASGVNDWSLYGEKVSASAPAPRNPEAAARMTAEASGVNGFGTAAVVECPKGLLCTCKSE